MKVYIDGRYYEREEARISVFDHGLLYGDGVFEGLRVYAGRAFLLKEHIDRIYDSARAILIEVPMERQALQEAVAEAVRVNEMSEGYIRLIVTRGEGTLGLDPSKCKRPSVIIIVTGIEIYPPKMYETGIAIVTAATRRNRQDCLESRVKSLNYLNNVMAKAEAARAGCLEAVMLNTEGYVAECTADNIFIVREGVVLSPPPYQGALDGITMRTVMGLAERLGLKAALAPMTRYDLYTAEECFLTGTGAEIMPVTEIDGRVISRGKPGAITKKLIGAFRRHVSEAV